MASMVTSHPTPAMLAAYAAGSATEGVSLLVAAHLTYCGVCRARVTALEAIGGALLGDAPAGGQAADGAGLSLDATLALLDAPAPAVPRSLATAPSPLPRPVAEAIGAPFEAIRWRFRMPGVSECPIDLGADERVSLLRVRPGAGVPAHTHTAEEATLVLAGSLCDRGRTFRAGDVAVATADDDHHPSAGPGEDCLCLAVLSGGLRFTGPFGRALNVFAE
jgi:putative transcriptional regulator